MTSRALLRGLWSALWPGRCPLCREILTAWGPDSFCPACESTIQAVSEPICQICGLPLSPASLPPGGACGRCAKEPPAFDRARAYGLYQGALASAVRDFKFRFRRSLAGVLASLMAAADGRWLGDAEVEAVVPVPLHSSRLRERGFNQAADLARAPARTRGVPVLYGALECIRPIREQTGLTLGQRRDNVRGAFKVMEPARVEGRAVLLVDDVLTTGATAHECARVLKRSGAAKVMVLTLARTGGP